MWAPFLFSDIYFLCFHNSTQPSVWEINCTVYYSTMCINSFGWVKIRTFKSWHQRTKKGVLGDFSTQSFSYFLGAEFPGKAVFEEQSEVHPCRTWGHRKSRRMGMMLQSRVLWQRSALERRIGSGGGCLMGRLPSAHVGSQWVLCASMTDRLPLCQQPVVLLVSCYYW